MKQLWFAIVIFLFSVCSIKAQVKLTEKQKLVQKVVIDLFQALSDRDTENLKSTCNPDLLLLENGIVWNLDTLVSPL